MEILENKFCKYVFVIKTFGLQIFIVAESIDVCVRPIAVADDADLAVHKVLSVSGVEKQHRQR